ncbi:MAG: histidine phosphatase family protein [Pseudomonadales bacterium]|nr:histidine phosphatase family protein [Pseudomonadales bacterium]
MIAGYDPNKKTTIDLIRHGEPEGGVMYRGSKDDPLSQLGWQQMREALNQAIDQGYQWQRVISSPLKRCREFAEETADKLQLDLEIVDDLQELNFGDLEGMRPKDAWEQYPELLSNMWNDPEQYPPPNGEHFSSFCQRVLSATIDIVSKHNNETMLFVVHGGVVRATLHNLLKVAPSATFRFDIPYASLTRFKLYPNEDDSFETAVSYVNGFRSKP